MAGGVSSGMGSVGPNDNSAGSNSKAGKKGAFGAAIIEVERAKGVGLLRCFARFELKDDAGSFRCFLFHGAIQLLG